MITLRYLTESFSSELLTFATLALLASIAAFAILKGDWSDQPLKYIPLVDIHNAEIVVRAAEPGLIHDKWMKDLNSHVFAYRNGPTELRLFAADHKVTNWVLGSNGYRYGPSPIARHFLSSLLGHGLVTAQGNDHRRQRRAINPAFSPIHLRDLVPLFVEISEKMVDRIEKDFSLVAKYGGQGGKVVEMQRHVSAATLDIVGRAAFAYDFGALATDSESDNELSLAFRAAMRSSAVGARNWLEMQLLSPPLLTMFPFLHSSRLIRRNRLVAAARGKMEAISAGILARKKEQIQDELRGIDTISRHHQAFEGTDLLHVLLRANMSSDMPASQNLNDSEMLGQITTFIFAGHETTSTAMIHTLRLLSEHPDVQAKLHTELDVFYAGLSPAGVPSWESINALPYLTKVLDEALRLAPPASGVMRTALQDDVIPLARPIPDANGTPNVHTHVRVRKGTVIFLALRAMNRDPLIWGDDADRFDPDRWDRLPQAYHEAHIPASTWSFSSGVKMCIGMRFATTELKVLVATVLRKWRLEPVERFKEAQFIVVRPVIVGRESEGGQLPVRLIPRS